MNLTPQNKDMKTAAEILKQMKEEMPWHLSLQIEPYILEAIQLAISQSLPPVSEEEIILQAEKKCGELQCSEGYAFVQGAHFVLSRLPQREDQPVGNPDKLEDKQRKDELSDLIKTVVDKKSDGCHNCSVNDCKIFSSGKKCGNWHGYPKDKPRRCFPGI